MVKVWDCSRVQSLNSKKMFEYMYFLQTSPFQAQDLILFIQLKQKIMEVKMEVKVKEEV